MLLGSLSRQIKDLEWRTLKPPRCVTALRSWIDHVIPLRSRKDHVIALRQISVTALFYLEDSRKIRLQDVRARLSKDTSRRAPQLAGESELALALLFICLSLSGPVLCKLGQPGVFFCFTWGPHSGPWTFFCFIFVGFSLPCLWPPPFWTPFPGSTYLTIWLYCFDFKAVLLNCCFCFVNINCVLLKKFYCS